MAHVQNLRIEEAKRQLETGSLSADEIAAVVGYENLAFFRRLFKRSTGLTPGAYRRMFKPLAEADQRASADFRRRRKRCLLPANST